MTDGPAPVEKPLSPSPRPAKRRLTFVMLAGVLAIVGALAAGYYFAMRPVTLRIAVGPANSDDLKVVQALTQAFNNQQHSQVRLRPIQTDGATASANLLGEGKADLAIIRGDLDVPKNAQAVATLRKNVVVLWVPPAGKVKGKKARAKITKIAQLAGRRIGVVGRTPANVNLLKVILQQYGVDPGKVEIIQFPANEAADAIRNQKADAYLAAGPVNSKITSDAIAASTRDGGTPTFLAIDLADAIAQNHPAYEASEIPAGTFGGAPDKPEEEVKTISFSHHIVARKGVSEIDRRRLHPATVRDPAEPEDRISAGREDRDAGHRQGRHHPGASRRRGLCRRRGKNLPRSLQRFHLVGTDGLVGDGLRRRVVRGLSQEGRAQRQQLAARPAAGHAHRGAHLRFDRRTRPDAVGSRRHPARHAAVLSSTARSRKAP